MNVPIEFWYALGGAVLTLIVSAAHLRGYRVPVLEILLDLVHSRATPPANEPAALERILDELRRRAQPADDAAKK
jgi:hypothetical protein